jgi:hypothetical protein
MFNWLRKNKEKKVEKNNIGALITEDSPSKDRFIKRPLSELDDYRYFSDMDTFFRYLAREVVVIANCIRRWQSLCSTRSRYEFEGSESEVKKARECIERLGEKLYSEQGIQKDGIQVLTDSFFTEMFTVGRFGFSVVPESSGNGIKQIKQYDTYNGIQWVEMENGQKLPFVVVDGNLNPLPPYFYYNAFNRSFKFPAGHSLLWTIEWVARVEEQLLLDMAVSTHNIGNPRMHMKIKPPSILPGENQKQYLARADKYFDDTVDKFKTIEVDDNIFTWDSVEIEIIGAKNAKGSYTFKENIEVAAEEIIGAFGLYPWIVGFSHGATKNWVEVQFNTLLTDIKNLQNDASSIAEYIANLELKLNGIKAVAKFLYSENQNPNVHRIRQAEATHFDTVHKKVLTGYIDKNVGARELGYVLPFNQEIVNLNKKDVNDGKEKDGDGDNTENDNNNGLLPELQGYISSKY